MDRKYKINTEKPMMIPAKAKPLPVYLKGCFFIWFKARKPRMTPRMAKNPKKEQNSIRLKKKVSNATITHSHEQNPTRLKMRELIAIGFVFVLGMIFTST